MAHSVLLAEDEPILRVTLAEELRDEGYEVTATGDGAEALGLIGERPFDIALLDLKLPKVDGMRLLQSFKAANPSAVALMMTAYGTIQSAVAAIKAGASDYLPKPFSVDELRIVLRTLTAPHTRPAVPREAAVVRRFGDMLYASEAMARICELIATVAPSDATVLIQGETGTGKELVARAIHERGARHEFPMVAVACAAIPETLLEAELFGHEKGAFTGAIRERKGRFELAHRGSLFLDEVADLGAAVQAKLLRVLQEREFERIGSSRTIKADVRLISATRKRLEDEVLGGRLREDLFYRLKVITITLPPLRERKEDIFPLAEHFMAKYSKPLNKEIRGLSNEASRLLLGHAWPGNVRELEASIQQAVTLAKGHLLAVPDFPSVTAVGEKTERTVGNPVQEAERQYLREVLRGVGGQRKRAAEVLGISRKTLWKKMRLHGLE
jgi:two-component system response regulator HydG